VHYPFNMEKRSRRVMRHRFEGFHLPGSVWAPTEYRELEKVEDDEPQNPVKLERFSHHTECKSQDSAKEPLEKPLVQEQARRISSPVKLPARAQQAHRFVSLEDSLVEKRELENIQEKTDENAIYGESPKTAADVADAARVEPSPQAEPETQVSPPRAKTSPKNHQYRQVPKTRRWSIRQALSVRAPPAAPTSPVSAATVASVSDWSAGTGAATENAHEHQQTAATDTEHLTKTRPATTISLPDRVVKNNFPGIEAIENMSLPSVSPAAQSDASAFSVGDIVASSNDSGRWDEEPFEKLPSERIPKRASNRRRSALARMLVCFR